MELGLCIPIIALTANAIKGESDRCREAGMSDFVAKPFEESELINKLVTWIDPEKAKAGKTPIQDRPASPDLMNVQLYDLFKLKQISRGNKIFEQRMIRLFIEQNPAMIQQMAEAWEQEDIVTVRAIAHKLKPSMDNMGIYSIYQLVRDIEKFPVDQLPAAQLSGMIQQVQDLLNRVISQLQELQAAG